MKKFYLFLLFIIGLSFHGFSQKRASFHPQQIKDGEYTIQLMPSPGGGYGFDIFKGKLLLVHQMENPIMDRQPGEIRMPMQGLKSTDDALKVAHHLVSEARKNSSIPTPYITRNKANELHIHQ